MFQQKQIGIQRTARLVLDVREWFGTVFAGGPEMEVPKAGGGVEFVRAIVRPTVELKITAEPTKPRAARWPFSGPIELVTIRTASGLLVFFGRVRSPGGGPLRRLSLGGTTCRLTIEGPDDEYKPAVLEWVPIPDKGQPPRVIRVEMIPGRAAAPGPTQFGGVVVTTEGQPRSEVEVSLKVTQWLRLPRPGEVSPRPDRLIDATAEAKQPAVVKTDSAGLWRFTLDGQPRETMLVEVKFALPPDVTVPGIRLECGRANRFPQTVLRGYVGKVSAANPDRLDDVDGAEVTVTGFAEVIKTKTRADGSWVFYPALSEPLSGKKSVKVRVVPKEGDPQEKTVDVVLGEANDIPPFIIA
jgi:hypothetical protein